MTVNWDDQSKSSKKMTSSVFRNVFIRFYVSNNPSISLLDINIELKLILAHFGIILAHCASVASTPSTFGDTAQGNGIRALGSAYCSASLCAADYYHHECQALKGKFSSGIEGALASTLNHNFNWKQLSEIILCIFLLMFSKFI